MYKEKLFLLFSYCIILGHRGDKLSVLPKLMDPLLIMAGFPLTIIGALIGLSFLYLFFSAILKPYGKNIFVLRPILIVFSLSVILEFFGFNQLSTSLQIYFIASVSLYIFSAYSFFKALYAEE